MVVAQPVLPMEGVLPPDLQGTLFRVGPGAPSGGGEGSASGGGADEAGGEWDGERHGERASDRDGEDRSAGPGTSRAARGLPGALHAMELRDGAAVSSLSAESDADEGVFWHAGSILALPEAGLPLRYTRFLEARAFEGGLKAPVASHTHRLASDGSRVLFSVQDRTAEAEGEETAAVAVAVDEGISLLLGEWDAGGGLRTAQAVTLERATWQHDVAVTDGHVVFIESPTARLRGATSARVPFGWVPGAEGWAGVVPRGADGSDVRWFRYDPGLVTHVLGAWEEGGDHGREPDIVLFVCRYDAPEPGQPVDLSASAVGPEGIGLTPIGGSLAVLERWRLSGDRLERSQVDERFVEYPRLDALCEGGQFRYGYCVETAWGAGGAPGAAEGVAHTGLLKFDLQRDEVGSWTPGPGRTPSEPIFVRARDGHSDDEGWLLTLVDDPDRGASDLYVLDASSFGRRRPEAVIHLPQRLPFRSHGEWVPADRYR
jgi:carotenoid cleavage dioxygenase-like enzyme